MHVFLDMVYLKINTYVVCTLYLLRVETYVIYIHMNDNHAHFNGPHLLIMIIRTISSELNLYITK